MEDAVAVAERASGHPSEQEPPHLAAGFVFLSASRLIAWAVAAVTVVVDTRPPENLKYEPQLLILTLMQIAFLLAYVPLVRPALRRWTEGPFRGRTDLLWLSAVDMVAVFAVLYFSGGLNTPYYHFAIVALLLPSFLLGWRGSLLVLAAFVAALLLTWVYAGYGREVWWNRDSLGGSLPGQVFTAALVVVVSQYLAWLVRRLEEGQRLTRAALEETAALYGVALTFSTDDEPSEVARDVVNVVGRTRRFDHVSVWEHDDDGLRRVAAFSRPGSAPPAIERAMLAGNADEDDAGLVDLVPRSTDGDSAGESLRGLPIRVQQHQWGVLAFRCPIEPPPMDDVRLLRAVVSQLSLGLTKIALLRDKEELAAVEERGRIAREIHDGIAQSIYMLSLNLEKAAEMANEDPTLGRRLRGLVGVAKEALLEVRHYIFDLKPLLAGDRTLVSTIRAQVKEFGTVSELDTDLQVTGEERADLPVTASSALYRVVQEALANAYRHAEATRVTVSLTFEEEQLIIEVRDDGSGFAMGDGAATESFGRGLRNMHERAAEVGATLDVGSSSGSGTVVRLAMPLAAPVAAERAVSPATGGD
jgi:signal transduction histidine kinase